MSNLVIIARPGLGATIDEYEVGPTVTDEDRMSLARSVVGGSYRRLIFCKGSREYCLGYNEEADLYGMEACLSVPVGELWIGAGSHIQHQTFSGNILISRTGRSHYGPFGMDPSEALAWATKVDSWRV